MDAKDLERFRKNGEEWVRFNVKVKDTKTKKVSNALFERRVERNVKVRGAGGAEHRPVVMMTMCIGDKIYKEEFSLKDRGDMNYPVLIGRKTLGSWGRSMFHAHSLTNQTVIKHLNYTFYLYVQGECIEKIARQNFAAF